MVKPVLARALVALCVFLAPALTTRANAQSLYGATPGATSQLYLISPANGGFTAIGDIGFGITGLAFHPQTGELYGTQAGVPGDVFDRNLIKIDTATGRGTIVGPVGLGFGGIADIAFRADGTLFGWSETTDDLITINLTTGAGTVVGNSGVSTRGSGLAFNAAGTLYLAGSNGNGPLRTVNTASGITTIVATLTGAPQPTQPIPAMKFHPVSDVLYAVNRTINTPFAGHLITINTTTGVVTTIGTTVPRIDALAWSPVPQPPPPVPTAFPPTITQIANQVVPQNGSLTVPFTIAGAILPSALRVSVSSSTPPLFPVAPSTLSTTCNSAGSCSLHLAPADGRAGHALITLSVFDGFYTTSTNFLVTVVAVRPSTPAVVLANVVGSGIVVTWLPPESGPTMAYAIAWGTATGAANLPTQIVPGTETRLDFSSLPNGTYFFRVYAVGTGDLSPPSPQASATVTAGAAAPGPPPTLEAALISGGFRGTWRAPLGGATPTLYEVHVGTTPGASNVGSSTTPGLSLDMPVGPGSYWTRTRAVSGGATGAWSSSVQIPVGAGPCAGPPGVPVLLPVMSRSGLVTFTWWPMGAAADTYQVQVSFGAGLPPAGSASTSGPGTSLVVGALTSGSFAARVVATNACGSSAPSNEVAFTITP